MELLDGHHHSYKIPSSFLTTEDAEERESAMNNHSSQVQKGLQILAHSNVLLVNMVEKGCGETKELDKGKRVYHY